jgi:predicted transposase/invertase (TIGR01784 family)
MKFADVKNDIAFRKIFGNENRTESLISFLNAVLGFEGKDKIVSVTIVNPYQLPKLKGGKVSILDVRATDQKKQQFIVEMQVAEQDGFSKRVLYYLTKSYNSQIRRADQYRKLKPAYFIGILNFSHTKNPKYISRNRIQDIDTGEVTIKDVDFSFIELGKFTKTVEQLETLTDKWIYFIKNAENLELIPENVDDKGLLSAYKEANQHTWSQEELDAYDYADMRKEDGRAQTDAAVKKALAKAQKQAEKEKEEMQKQAEKEKREMQKQAEKEKQEMQKQAEAEKQEMQKQAEKMQKQAEKEKEEMQKQAEAEKEQTVLMLNQMKLSIKDISLAVNKTEQEITKIFRKYKK